MRNIGIEETIKTLTKALNINEKKLQSSESSAEEKFLSGVLKTALRELDFRVEKAIEVVEGIYECPKCKTDYDVYFDDDFYNYCPNCGQKLKLIFENSNNEDED